MNRLAADRISGALTLLLLAALTTVAWLLAELGLRGPISDGPQAPETVKASLQGIELQRTDLNGHRLYVILAKAGTLTEEGTIALVQPSLERLLAGSQHTQIRAGSATLSADQSTVQLTGGVTTTQARATQAQGLTQLTTEALLVRPLEERASTPGEVRIDQPGRSLTGSGLELNLRSGEYRILSNTRLELRP